ncbi:glycosyltransferase family 4 protein [Chromatium okenii]|uniref:glycosyltransferase family 4 protein n=1 Tax=Chromatium okenii TaxID=61644 RepID=UPI0026EB55AF|nr:glycosyltransferase family 4 protein [Chromatium okenii]MBV5309191.1 glycosyltransferase family 4 protein [Chromatium okenii]
MTRPIRTLLFSTLYPNCIRPGHGIFVETRLKYLLASGEVETRVIAPVPWFPFKHQRFGSWSQFAQIPNYEEHHGIEVWHPRYVLPPKIGMNIAPFTLALSARHTVANLINSGFDFDVIDAHYYYPDGVAAALLAKWFNKPLFITARGTDLNLIPNYTIPRRLIQWAAQRATGSIGVCKALTDTLIQLGGDVNKIHVLRNGVDLQRFNPQNQVEARLKLGLPMGQLLLSVGYLIERKGHHLAIEALAQLPQATLAIVGEGEEREHLRQQAQALSVSERVIFAGARPQTELKDWYSAADMLLLCSSREGWANVLLESMACGTPVVATAVGGTPEVVQLPIVGRIMRERSVAALIDGIQLLNNNYPDRTAVRKYAEQFDWEMTTQGQIALFRSGCGREL